MGVYTPPPVNSTFLDNIPQLDGNDSFDISSDNLHQFDVFEPITVQIGFRPQKSEDIRHDNCDKDLIENTFGNIDPDSIAEFKPMDPPVSNSPFNSEEPFPYYINHIPNDPTFSVKYDPVVHPTLYLFSPATNTLIPCQQIIIPNSNSVPGGSSAIFLADNGQEITQLSPNFALESGKSR